MLDGRNEQDSKEVLEPPSPIVVDEDYEKSSSPVTSSAGNDTSCYPTSGPSSSQSRGSSRFSSQVPISPVLETEIEHSKDALQSQEYVRYGDTIKLWATSQYLKNELRKSESKTKASPMGGYIGIYEKKDGTARLSVPPIGDSAEGIFRESMLRIQSPDGAREDGIQVRYGEVVVLVDENGQVWNNKCGTGTFSGFFEGYLGPKPRGSNGEVYVSFQKNGHGMKPLIYGENAVYIDVAASHRVRSSYNYRLTNYRSSSSRVSGGYICSDGTGYDLPFSVHRSSGPPGKFYHSPNSGSPALPHLSNNSYQNEDEVYMLPRMLSVGVLRSDGYFDVMIKDPQFGAPIKVFDVTRDDKIVIALEQENASCSVDAADIFDPPDLEKSTQSSMLDPHSIILAIEDESNVTPCSATSRTQKHQMLRLTALELSVEQSEEEIRHAFGTLHDPQMIEDSVDDEEFSQLNLLIASHKLVMAYSLCAVFMPYFFWQVVLFAGDLIAPIHHHTSPTSKLLYVEQFATKLVNWYGIHVENGQALISDELREVNTTTLFSSLVSLLLCYMLGLVTPAVARTSSVKKRQIQTTKRGDKRNFLISLQVPAGAWSQPEAFDSEPQDGQEEQEAETKEEETSKIQSGLGLGGTWGSMGEDENGVPKHPAFARFLAGEKGNMKAAIARWIRTCQWRVDTEIDAILDKPHPNFHLIRKNIPNFYYGRSKQGYPIYIDCPGQVKLKVVKKAGMTLADLLFHFVYSTEFLWTLVEPSEEGKTVSILDLEGIGMFDFAGDVIDFVKKTVALSGEHYPERAHRIFIVNAPRFFTGIWSIIKPWLDEATRKKICLHRTNYKDVLLEEIDEEVLPEKYGGKCQVPLGQSEEDRLLESHVCRKLIELGVPMKDENGKDTEGSPQNLAHLVDDSLVSGVSRLKLDD